MPLLAAITDAAGWTGWDKAGAVAIAVLCLFAMLMLHRRGLNRVDKISDAHVGLVKEQTEATTLLIECVRQLVESNRAVHVRIDLLLDCTRPDCAVFQYRKKMAKQRHRFESAAQAVPAPTEEDVKEHDFN